MKHDTADKVGRRHPGLLALFGRPNAFLKTELRLGVLLIRINEMNWNCEGSGNEIHAQCNV